MRRPVLTELVTLKSPGEFRAAALARDGRAWRAFSLRFRGQHQVLLGQTFTAHVRSLSPAQGGAFVELNDGNAAFLSFSSRSPVREGQAIKVEVVAEARADKLAKVKLTDQGLAEFDAFAAWKMSLPVSQPLPEREDRERVTAAFQDAEMETVGLPNGGRLHIQPTRALIALDIDTAGRETRGSAGARALSINRDAAFEAARQIALRNLGGAVILDCVAPLNRLSGDQVRVQFVQAFQAVSSRSVEVLAPSRFGLMEAAIKWGARPIHDRVETAESLLLKQLGDVSREAVHTPAALYEIQLDADQFDIYQKHKTILDEDLKSMFGGRVALVKSPDKTNKVVRR